jgi:hypothetical protein
MNQKVFKYFKKQANLFSSANVYLLCRYEYVPVRY